MTHSSPSFTFIQEKRKLAHLRRIKVEKMKELLENERRGGGSSNSQTSTPTRRAPPPPAAYNVPAPVAAPANNWAPYPQPGGYMSGNSSYPNLYANNSAPPPPNHSYTNLYGGGGAAPPQGAGNLPYPINPSGMPYPPGYR